MRVIHKSTGVIVRDRKTLVVRSTGKDFFISPGGKLEDGETAQQALVRELKEECGVDVAIDNLEFMGAFEAEAEGKAGVQVRIEAFLVMSWQGEPSPGSEIEEVAWITSDYGDMRLGSIFAHDIIPRLKKLKLID